MERRILAVSSVVFLAFSILLISIFRVAAPQHTFLAFTSQVLPASESDMRINYELPYPGKILPDHPLWFIKALRDRLWILATTSNSKKAELYLLFSDKRLESARILFEKGKADLAFSTLTKAEKYLELAQKKEESNRQKGLDTKNFLSKLANASLKHRQVINNILEIAPEDARPEIIKIEEYSRNVYEKSRDALNSFGMPVPANPFNGD